jgi:hypothetical protein
VIKSTGWVSVARTGGEFFHGALKALGAVGCTVTFGFLLFLSSYYSAKRPHAPRPDRDWTVAIRWTHPTSFGPTQEANRVKLFFNLFLPFFCLMLLAEVIKVYKLDDYSGLPPLKRPSFPEHK